MTFALNYFTYKTNVRIEDINFGNHLCHSKFINIIHNARALFFKEHGFSESNCFGCGMVVLSLNIDYLCQCLFGDFLEVNLCIDTIEKATISLSYTIFNHTSNKLAARATTKMGFINLQKSALKRTPIEFKKLMNSFINNN